MLLSLLAYILGMKLESEQDRDKQDSGEIIKLVKIRSIKDAVNKLKEYGFEPDVSMILEAVEIAYVIEWLAEYIIEHLEEFKHY